MNEKQKRLVKELMASGCEYDEAVRLIEQGVRMKRIEEKRDKRDESSRRRTRAQI